MSSSNTNLDKIPQSLEDNPEFMKVLSNLPKHNWKVTNLYQYERFWYPSFVVEGIVSAQQHYQALPMDIVIAGAPKTGNTWLKSLCFAISTRGKYQNHPGTENPLLSNFSHALVPFLENLSFTDPTMMNARQHKLISTHLPYTSLPESVRSSGCKIVYICREPKDTFVSWWHFVHRIHVGSIRTSTEPTLLFDEELDMFCEGKTPFGPYWDNVLGYYKVSLDTPDKVMFLKYEVVKKDTSFYVKKLAEFMDVPFSIEEEVEGVPEKIVKLCSFRNLSGLEVNKAGKYAVEGRFQIDKESYFRKGDVGDWKNHLTPEMAERIDKISHERLQGCSFAFG